MPRKQSAPGQRKPVDPSEQPGGFWHSAIGITRAILGDDEGPEWRAGFDIVREVRGHPDSANYRPIAVAKRLYREFPELAEHYPSEEDFMVQFANIWKKVRNLPGEDILGTALRYADETPLSLREEHEDDATPGYRRFISLAGWLCVAAGSRRIKLPCREVGEILGVRPNTVSCYREQAVEHGYMVKSADHVYRPGGRGEATQFEFAVDLWDCLTDRLPKQA